MSVDEELKRLRQRYVCLERLANMRRSSLGILSIIMLVGYEDLMLECNMKIMALEGKGVYEI